MAFLPGSLIESFSGGKVATSRPRGQVADDRPTAALPATRARRRLVDGNKGILALMSLLGIKHGERAGVIAPSIARLQFRR